VGQNNGVDSMKISQVKANLDIGFLLTDKFGQRFFLESVSNGWVTVCIVEMGCDPDGDGVRKFRAKDLEFLKGIEAVKKSIVSLKENGLLPADWNKL